MPATSSGGRGKESSSKNALSFLQRTDRSSPSLPSPPASPWPVGFVPPHGVERARAWKAQTGHGPTPRLPRNSALAFLERAPIRQMRTSGSSTCLVAGAGAEDGLGTLSGGVMAAGSNRGGFLPQPHEGDDSGSECSEEKEDSDICPSMLFSCFPCCICFRSQKRRPPNFLDAHMDISSGAKRDPQTVSSLSTPLLSDRPPSPEDFPKDVKLIEVEVESARNLPLGERVNMADLAGTYAILRMTPVQEGVGEQTAQTSVATRPVNPSWGGRETFTFFVTHITNSKAFLALQLLYRPLRPPPAPPPPPPPSLRRGSSDSSVASVPCGSRPGDVVIGEGFVDLLALFPAMNGKHTPGGLTGNSGRVTVPMREPEGKRRTRCSVMLGLRCRRVNETIDTHEDRLYEYERWTPLAGWNSAGKRRAGKWGTLDGSALSDTFVDVAPPAREGAEVVLPWCPFGGWEYSREEMVPAFSGTIGRDRDGQRDEPSAAASSDTQEWENFAVAQKGAVWMEGYVQGYQAVRRRLWRRVTAA